MSLYNVLVKTRPFAALVFRFLDINPVTVDRMRDADVITDEEGYPIQLVILTRTGGNNREAHTASNARLAAHPWYLRDEDEAEDQSYASFYFDLPTESLRKILIPMINMVKEEYGPSSPTPFQRFLTTVERIQNNEVDLTAEQSNAIGRQIVESFARDVNFKP